MAKYTTASSQFRMQYGGSKVKTVKRSCDTWGRENKSKGWILPVY